MAFTHLENNSFWCFIRFMLYAPIAYFWGTKLSHAKRWKISQTTKTFARLTAHYKTLLHSSFCFFLREHLRDQSLFIFREGWGVFGSFFWDHIIFRVNGGGDQSSVTEYKERTIEDWLPMRRIIRVLQSCSGGIRDQANFITTPPKSFYPLLPCSVIINCPVLTLWWTDTHVKLAVRFILNLKNPKRNSGYSLLNTG